MGFAHNRKVNVGSLHTSLPAYNYSLDIIKLIYKLLMALYKVLVGFEFGGLSYEEGKTYEFDDETVASLPTENLELAEGLDSPAENSEVEADAPAPSEEGAEEPKEDAPSEDAPGWAGGHTVGRE